MASRGRAQRGIGISPSAERCWPQPVSDAQRVAGEGSGAGSRQRVTLPALRHEVQTLTRFGAPLIKARTRWMFGSKRRFVRRCECETL